VRESTPPPGKPMLQPERVLTAEEVCGPY
jgi:hypothetical protein